MEKHPGGYKREHLLQDANLNTTHGIAILRSYFGRLKLEKPFTSIERRSLTVDT
jgi:hypothetical protein